MSGKRKAADAGVGFFSTLFERVKKGGKDGAKALKELEKGVSTRAGGKKGAETVKGTTTRNLGKGYGLRDPKTGRMLTKSERTKVVSSGRKRIGAGTLGAAGTAYILSGDDKAKDKDKGKADKNKAGTTAAKKKTITDKKVDDGKKTFRERRLARMKKRLEGSENEGRKRRLKRRIGRVEGRIEDTKERRAARGKAGGGEMVKAAVPGYKDGKLVKKQGANDRLDESLGMRRGKESTKSQSMKSRRNESRGARKPSRPQSAGAATRGWGAAIR